MAVASVKDNDIEAAAAMDNVDRAAKHLQDLAGIATGDVASTHPRPCGAARQRSRAGLFDSS
jgi:hypothetical protein